MSQILCGSNLKVNQRKTVFFVGFSALSLSVFVLQGIEGKKLVGEFQRAG